MLMQRYLMTTLCLAALCGRALAAREAPAAAPTAPSDPMSKVLPEVSFDSVTLDDALDFLQSIAPEFKAVVVRENGVPEGYPKVRMRLKNVTLGQVWSVLQAANPELEVQPVEVQTAEEGPARPPIYLIRVKAPTTGAPEVAVRVYALGPVEQAMSAKGGGGKEAAHGNDSLDRVLSLIKATLAQVPGSGEPVLQVHEETRTLIFKGSADQKAALEDVLAALVPAMPTEVAGYKKNNDDLQQQVEMERTRFQMQIRKFETDVSELRSRLAEEEKNSLERTMEAEKLKVRLEEQTDRMNETKKRLAEQTDELTKLKDLAHQR